LVALTFPVMPDDELTGPAAAEAAGSPRPPLSLIAFSGRDGNRLAADAAGPEDGPAVILLHGGGQTRHSWGTTLERLATDGWRAYSVDLRGHGDSEWAADGDYTLEAFAADVKAVAASISGPLALVGASLGGLASLLAVGSAPQAGLATALVLVDVAPRVEEAGRDRIGRFMEEHMQSGFGSLDEVADAIARYNPHRPRPKDLSGLRTNLRERDGRWYWHWDPAFIQRRLGSPDGTRTDIVDTAQLEAVARHVTVPVLVIRGRVSDLLSEDGARQLLELLPDGEMISVAGAGHMVAGDRNDLFNEAVEKFLMRAHGSTPQPRRDSGSGVAHDDAEAAALP
jgi:pimeloyl-ACP methyl ester carboxylesterase